MLFNFFGKREEKRQGGDNLLFDNDRREILRRLEAMGEATALAVESAVASLVDRDDGRARTVIDGDDVIDAMEVEIEQICLRSLALRQPVREDLRFVFSVLKIITDMERTADQAVNIAKRALDLNSAPLLKPLIDIPRMATGAVAMIRDALRAFGDEDVALARDVFFRDDVIDDLNRQVFSELLEIMARSGAVGSVGQAADLILVARSLERVGDHASNIAERAYFMITGDRIKGTSP
ncbi:phosphate signaling complex protein PhoU [Aminithiophilus ramosus]|nr:phosphate signaling complex protein PhoU [Aminithiophilus ramosus]